MKAYYAHCMSIYGTPQEERDVALLESLGFDVLNPSESRFDEGWHTKGMDFAEELLGECQLVAFRALPDGAIPRGVYTELEIARREGLPVIELPSGVLRRGLGLDQTREYLAEIGER